MTSAEEVSLIVIGCVALVVAGLLLADYFIRRGNAKDIEDWKNGR